MKPTGSTETIDLAGLVEDGHLDLEAVFGDADWRVIDDITVYTACPDGDELGQVEIALESATKYGITAYRWLERDDSGDYETGPVTLDRDEAVRGGEEYAAEADETPDVDDLIQQIVETGYFGDATPAEIRAICETATKYSQGYLLLPAGEFCGRPIGRMWTTNGYLQCDHVKLAATHPNVAHAADALLRAVTASDED